MLNKRVIRPGYSQLYEIWASSGKFNFATISTTDDCVACFDNNHRQPKLTMCGRVSGVEKGQKVESV